MVNFYNLYKFICIRD